MNLTSSITKIAQQPRTAATAAPNSSTGNAPATVNSPWQMKFKTSPQEVELLVKFFKEKDPSLDEQQLRLWINNNAKWDKNNPNSTFEKWQSTPQAAEFNKWKEQTTSQEKQTSRQNEMQTLLQQHGNGNYDKIVQVKQMADYLRTQGFTDSMIARFNPNLYKAMQDYGIATGFGVSQPQLQNWQEQYYNQREGKPGVGRRLWETVNPKAKQKRLDDYYRGQYAKSKGKIVTAYDGSLLKKMSQQITPFHGPVGPDNPKSDDLGLSPDYNPRDDDTLGDIYKEHDSPESVDNISAFVLQRGNREQMVAQLHQELHDPANAGLNIHDWDEIIDIVNNHLRATGQPEITPQEFDYTSTKLNTSTKL